MIYLDYNATTPVAPDVLEEMLPWMSERFWNAASSHHGGRVAGEVVERAREQVGALIGARPHEIIWTSGATEANNLALKGLVELAPPHRRRVVTFATEHKAVLDTTEWLASRGVPITVLPVGRDGSLLADDLLGVLEAGDVAIVSVMAANNETGVLADLAQVADVTHEHGALLHTDATQMVGKLPFDVTHAGVDFASLSAHKMYGPKGTGALFVSRRTSIAPLIHGGGHERGMRSGTLNVPGVVGFGAAATLASTTLESESARQAHLRDRLVTQLVARLEGVVETTDHPRRLPNTANLRFAGADAEAVMVNAPDAAVSTGSACTSLVPTPSHVLLAMGLSQGEALECVRLSVGRPTTGADVDVAVESIVKAVDRVRVMTTAGHVSAHDPPQRVEVPR